MNVWVVAAMAIMRCGLCSRDRRLAAPQTALHGDWQSALRRIMPSNTLQTYNSKPFFTHPFMEMVMAMAMEMARGGGDGVGNWIW